MYKQDFGEYKGVDQIDESIGIQKMQHLSDGAEMAGGA